MVRNSGKPVDHKETESNSVLNNDLDELFKLPLADFTGARNTLAAQLKKSGRGDDAAIVKALAKPPISAWAVNQLYWNHRDAFERLIASGERFHKAQKSGAAKVGDMRGALDARREALSELSDLATAVLRNAGHNPALDTIRRITTTLEALSVYASRSDAPPAGRLTEDVDPPGFESLGAFTSSGGMTAPTRFTPLQKSGSAATNTQRKSTPNVGVRSSEDTRKANLAAAKAAVQDAKRSLTQARTRVQSFEATHKKALADAKEAEKLKRQAEERFQKSRASSDDAARRVRSVAAEVEEAAKAVKYAERIVEKTTNDLESIFRGK